MELGWKSELDEPNQMDFAIINVFRSSRIVNPLRL